ncbi:claudin-4-like [Erpetoichthys calabaricus]|uniref:claudin-4-like n=1 Tax=Erpetoichthys calabaricus TaxID=27687 RepID=UPI0022346494|nr:claudin-4-like [Erpetoichthys calabaricus]
MASTGLQILGIALAVLGWLAVIVVCALPMWRVTAFIGSNIVTAQLIWEGIWMNCVVQSTGQMQCKVYDSMLALSQDLQAARALSVISIVVGLLAILVSIVGGKCTNCVEDESTKAKISIVAGIAFILSGLLILIPVCWTANTVIRDFYNPLLTDAQRRELGASLYIALEMAGIALSVLGWMGVILICALPMWRVTAFIGSNIVVAQVFWEGLWMNCVNQSTGQMQCKVYDSLLALSQDLQAARAMVTISIAVGFLGILLSIVGAKCTNCVQEESIKARISITTGIMFIITGLLTLIPVCWTANTVIRDFYNPLLTDAQRRELGACLYVGWACSAGLIAGGALLCCTCPPKEDNHYSTKYSVAKSTAPSKVYV